jgi:exosome complex RNA-binding protein Csl4
MDQSVASELADLFGKSEFKETQAAIDAYDAAVSASGTAYVDSVTQGVASADIVYAQVVSSTTAAYR